MRLRTRALAKGVSGLLGFLVGVSAGGGGSARADDWISHGANAAHARLSAERSGAGFGAGGWTYALPTGAATVSSPAIADGYVVFGAFDGVVRALRARDGQLLWSAKVGDTIYAAPAIDRGKVFVPSLDSKLYAFRLADGSIAWTKEMGGLEMASPIVVDGAVIVSAGFPQRHIVKLDGATGQTVWVSPSDALAQFSNTAAAVATDQVIVGANGGHYYSFDLATGALRWSYEAPGIVNLSAPVVVGDAVFMLPGGDSRQVHAVDLRTGQALAGWPIDLPAAEPDIAGDPVARDVAVSSPAAVGGTLLLDMRVDDSLDTDKNLVADRFLLRESVVAIDIASATIRWSKDNGRLVVVDPNDVPKFWLCPSPAVFQTGVGPVAAVTSSLDTQARVLDVGTGAARWTVAIGGATQVSPALANGRLFLASSHAISGLLSDANQPPPAPVLAGDDGRSVSAVGAVVRWGMALDPEGDAVSYQLRVDRDGEVLESWEQEIQISPGQTSAHLAKLQTGTVYTVALRARDSKGAWSDWSAPQTLTAAETPPVALDGQSAGDLISALGAARAGSVVRIGAGVYHLGETLHVAGGVSLVGEGAGRTVLSGAGLGNAVVMEGNVAGQPSQIARVTIADAVVGVLVRDTQDAEIKNVIVRDNSEAGVEVSASGSAKLANGTLLRNGKAVKAFGTIAVKNSIVTKNQVAFYADSASAISDRFNDLYDNTTNFHLAVQGLGDFDAPVTWMNMPAGDFHLPAGQASTDRGDPADDFSAEPLPNGGRINLGAFGGTAEAELSVEDAPAAAPVDHHAGGCALAAPGSPGPGLATLLPLVALAAAFRPRRRR